MHKVVVVREEQEVYPDMDLGLGLVRRSRFVHYYNIDSAHYSHCPLTILPQIYVGMDIWTPDPRGSALIVEDMYGQRRDPEAVSIAQFG